MSDRHAQVYWTDQGRQALASNALGLLARRGDCWQGEGASICYADTERQAQAESPSPLGSAIAGLAQSRTITCLFSPEEAARPGGRMVMRGTALSTYDGDIPVQHSFVWDGGDMLTMDGSPSVIVDRDGEKVAARLVTGAAQLPSRLPETFTADEQAAWQRLRGIADGMGRIGGQATGTSDRIIILDFAQSTGIIATFIGGQLSEGQAGTCM